MSSSKYEQTAELLRRRIEHGDYCNSPLPGAPKLAQELGLSYMTIRQAMQHLVNSNSVIRAENGRLVVPGVLEKAPQLKVAFLHPATTSASKWCRAIAAGAQRYGCSYQDIPFLYCDDQIIFDAVDNNFDLLFFQIPAISPILLGKMLRHREKLVSLFTDLTDYGIRRFDGFTSDAVERLIAFLHGRGCRRIDFFNTEPSPSLGNHRQRVWEQALVKYGCTGNAYDDHVTPPGSSSDHARTALDRLIREGRLRDTDALFCNSMSVTRGALRALADHKIRVPEEMAIVSFGNPEEAQLNTPSVTIVNTPNLKPLVDRIYEHYLGIDPTPERLHYQIELEDVLPEEIILHGESVADCYIPKNSAAKNSAS